MTPLKKMLIKESVIGKRIETKKGLMQKLWELVWVPGKQLRGTSYSMKI